MKNKFLTLLVLAASMQGAAAQTPSALPDTSRVQQLQEAEVRAGRVTRAMPMAFTNVEKPSIESLNSGRDLPFLLNLSPSVTTTSDTGLGIGYTTLRLRGVEPSRINISANGIPLNEAESHEVFWVNLGDFASSAASVQIQRGAGTSVNGAGAFGGSVNILSDATSPTPYASLDASYGSYRSNKETLRLGTGLLHGHWALDARLSHISTDGYVHRGDVKLQSFFTQAAYFAARTSVKILFFGGRERTAHAWNYATREEMALYGRRYNSCGQYVDDAGVVQYYPDQIDYYTQRHAQLHVNHAFPRGWKISGAVHFTKGDGYYEEYKAARRLAEYGLQPWQGADGALHETSDLVRRKEMNNYFVGQTLNAEYARGPWALQMGQAFNFYDGAHFGRVLWVKNYTAALAPLHEYYRNNAYKEDANAYAKGTYRPVRGLSFYADLQLRYVNYRIRGLNDTYDFSHTRMQRLDVNDDFLFLNPKAGLTYEWRKRHRAYASFALAQKEPTRNCYTDGHLDAEGLLSPYPRRELLRDYEAGYAFEHPRGAISAGVYFMDYKDQLVSTGEVNEIGEPLATNVPSSYRMGVEIAALWKPVQWFRWEANCTLSRNCIKRFTEIYYDDETHAPIACYLGTTPISFSPAVIFKNSLTFVHKGFTANAQTQYISRQYLTNGGLKACSLRAYTTTDLHLSYTFKPRRIVRSVLVGCSVYNAFNAKYESNGYAGSGASTDASGVSHRYYYAYYAAQAGTNVMGRVKFEF